jgi:hypothetical protein
MGESVTLVDVIDLTAKLSPEDRVRLLQHLQASQVEVEPNRPSWFDIQGAVPYPMCGEDAQAWVSRSRREDQEHRDRANGREPL